ncbi:autotransporter domain-containing protein [Rhizobium vallis]|nr:autotransporter domain-containing protein [Rhizobium vallis]
MSSTALVGGALSGNASAADWTGASSNDWFTIGNWNTGAVPTASDDATVNSNSPIATIDGASAHADTIVVGDSATGRLWIQNTGTLSSNNAVLGNLVGSVGMAGIAGAGATWTNSADLTIGNFGIGSLTIYGTGSATNAAGIIGAQTGSNGTVTVGGLGSTWANSGDLTVGDKGTGALTISSGGVVSNASGIVGNDALGNGTATVGGAGSTWTNSGDLTVGASGNGSLFVVNGGRVESIKSTMARSAESYATVTVDGAGSEWSSMDYLEVGHAGKAELTISNGGFVNNSYGFVGGNSEARGTIVVTGAGSLWSSTASVLIGVYGEGTLTITNGGSVKDVDSFIAYNGGSVGKAIVDGAGSTWTNSGDLTVGSEGAGSLIISNGGKVFDDNASIGGDPSGIGTAIVDGAGSTWTTTTSFGVGVSGIGHLQVSNGGALITAGADLGLLAGATGTIRVDGTGSTWTVGGGLGVGVGGNGSLTITNGGLVHGATGTVGGGGASSGAVNVDGAGSTWITDGTTAIGNSSGGTLTITNGGLVTDMFGILGLAADVTGTGIVDGPGSSWTSSSDLMVGKDGTGVLTLSNGGEASASTLVVSHNAGSTGTLNIGGAAGGPAAGAGIVNAPLVRIGAGGTVNFNHTEAAYDFGSIFDGSGTINQLAGNTNITGTSGTFVGATNVHGGRLAVNGSLAGSIVTVFGGVLGGTGTVGGIVANAGGTVGPGNSIGTLNVNGDVTFMTGSTYQVEVAGTSQSDLIAATGTATLSGGSVEVVKPAGGFVLNSHYTILTAAGGITGAFDGASAATSLPFLRFGLSTDLNNVYLDIDRSAATFASVGVTRNQKAAGAGIESTDNAIADAIIQFDTASALDAFDALSGEIHASAKGVLLEDDRFVREAALDRLRDAERGKQGDTGLWMHGFGSWGAFDGDGNAAAFDRDIGGFVVGADNEFSTDVTVGLLGGYSRSTFQLGDSRRSSGSSDNYQLGLYGGTQWGNLAFRAGTVYTWHELETSRSVDFAGFSDRLDADYSAQTAQAFGEFAYRIETGDTPVGALAFEPFANLAYVNLATDGFNESGGAAALAGRDDNSGVTFTTLGVRASTQVSGVLSARGMLGWQHAFGDTTPTSDLSFDGGSIFTVAGVPIRRDAAVIEAGLDFTVTPAATFGLSYSGQFASDANDQSVHANLSVKF